MDIFGQLRSEGRNKQLLIFVLVWERNANGGRG